MKEVKKTQIRVEISEYNTTGYSQQRHNQTQQTQTTTDIPDDEHNRQGHTQVPGDEPTVGGLDAAVFCEV